MKRLGKTFEQELPREYKEQMHINAKNKGTAIWLTIGSLVITAVMFLLLMIPFFNAGIDISDVGTGEFFIFYGVFIVSMLAYIVLHELTHGVVYKIETGEKLTFGLTPAVAFCGVPNIFVYRKYALMAVLAPLVTWTVILAPVLFLLYHLSLLYYIGFSFIFALHLGGCIGDIYLSALLIFKYKEKTTLIRDTGPEQFIYTMKKKKSVKKKRC